MPDVEPLHILDVGLVLESFRRSADLDLDTDDVAVAYHSDVPFPEIHVVKLHARRARQAHCLSRRIVKLAQNRIKNMLRQHRSALQIRTVERQLRDIVAEVGAQISEDRYIPSVFVIERL